MSEDKPSNLWLIAMTMFNVLWAAAASVYLYKSLMFARDSIRPSLAALEALGLVVVPVEPTEAMLDAADVEWDCRVVDVYAAMIAAAPLTTARGG